MDGPDTYRPEAHANLHGGVTYNPIRTDRALEILKERVAATPEGKLFPEWSSPVVTAAMRECKVIHGWQGQNYTADCIRDTVAQHVHDAAIEAAALEAARVAGQWDSLDVTYKYAVESAGLRRPTNMHPKRPAKPISAEDEGNRRVIAAAVTVARRQARGNKASAGGKKAPPAQNLKRALPSESMAGAKKNPPTQSSQKKNTPTKARKAQPKKTKAPAKRGREVAKPKGGRGKAGGAATARAARGRQPSATRTASAAGRTDGRGTSAGKGQQSGRQLNGKGQTKRGT